MAKELQVNYNVDSSSVDKAIQKTGELKQLSKGLSIQYDIDGKPIDVVIDKSLNLQKQVKILTAELRRTKEGTAEFQLLSSKLNDAKDNLERVNAKSKDLFASLSLLPGPIGDFFGKLNGAIGLLKTFSGFSLKDIGNQFKEVGNDIKDIVSNFTGIGKAADSLDDLAKGGNNASNALATASSNAFVANRAANALTESTKEQIKAIQDSNVVLDRQADGTFKAVSQVENITRAGKIKTAVVNQDTAAMDTNTGALNANAAASKGAAASSGILAAALRFVGLNALAATGAVAALDAAIAATGIGLLIIGISTLVYKLIDWAFASEDVEGKVKDLTDAIAAQNRYLELNINNIDFATKKAELLAKIQGKSTDEINKITLQGLKDIEAAQTEHLDNLLRERTLAAQKRGRYEQESDEVRFRKIEELNKEIEKSEKDTREAREARELQELQNQIDRKDKGNKKVTDKVKEGYQQQLKELDAKIQLEIDKERTNSDTLMDLFKQRLALQMKLEKMSAAEIEVVKAENRKRAREAIIDDLARDRQVEIDAAKRRLSETATDTKEFYDTQREIARLEAEKAYVEAEKDEKTRDNAILNARSQFYEKIRQIDINAAQSSIDMAKMRMDNEAEGTQAFYDAMRTVQMEEYAKQQLEAQGNYEKLEQLKKAHEKNLRNIDVQEMMSASNLLKRRFDALGGMRRSDYQSLRDAEQKQYEAEKLAAQGNAAALETIEIEHQARMAQIRAQEVEARKSIHAAIAGAVSDFGNVLGTLAQTQLEKAQGTDKARFESAKKFAIAALIVERVGAIAQIVANTGIANAKAVAASPLSAGQPWVTINTVSAGISIAGIIAAAIQSANQIKSQQFEAKTGTGGAPTTVRGMARGGYIDGERHAQGGVMVNAEGGEAVMTRGAVTLFGPLLSALNQAGGGVPFNAGNMTVTLPDNPVRKNVAMESNLQIIKTYVVESELTTEQQRQARLKDLSTL